MRFLRRTRCGDDRGIALPMVMAFGLVMVLLVAGGLAAVTSNLRLGSTIGDSTRAYDAADAGVQDYVSRVNSDSDYVKYGNGDVTQAPFSQGSVLKPPTPANPAFGIAGTWASVPDGSASAVCPDSAHACFRYEVDNRSFATQGVVRLRSTGRYGASTRSLLVTIKRTGFINYLYFTDYEVQDPQFSNVPSCAVHKWEDPSRWSGCDLIFTSADSLDGPVHSNDEMIAVCGSRFADKVTTGNPGTPVVDTPASCKDTVFPTAKFPGYPKFVGTISMPPTNNAMANQTRSDLTTNPGCLYTGPTVVRYNGDGKMTVWSPWTAYTNVTGPGSGKSPSRPDKCGAAGTRSGQLGSPSGATVDELAGNLLYVQTVPSSASDPNYAATTAIPAGMTCVGADGSSAVNDAAQSVGWKFGPWRFPTVGEAAPDGSDGRAGMGPLQWDPLRWSTSSPAYNCRNGDLYLQGTYTTQTTAAADDLVYVIGDVKAQDTQQDVLGIVGNNAVLVWNPVNALGQPVLYNANGSVDMDREIDGAILSVAHCFQVQNYNRSPDRGDLIVKGSIAQKFRGRISVASGVSGGILNGYAKRYTYGSLLKDVTPPYFLAPSSTAFEVQLIATTAGAFTASGSVR